MPLRRSRVSPSERGTRTRAATTRPGPGSVKNRPSPEGLRLQLSRVVVLHDELPRADRAGDHSLSIDGGRQSVGGDWEYLLTPTDGALAGLEHSHRLPGDRSFEVRAAVEASD